MLLYCLKRYKMSKFISNYFNKEVLLVLPISVRPIFRNSVNAAITANNNNTPDIQRTRLKFGFQVTRCNSMYKAKKYYHYKIMENIIK